MVEKLIYKSSGLAVKRNDIVDTHHLGSVTVKNIHAPRKHSGHGRVTLILADGRVADYPPSVIDANWLIS